NNSSVLVRRACLTEIGGLSEESELVAIEDYDAWIRLAHRAAKFVRLDQTLGYYWVGGGNTSNAKRQLSTTAAIRVRHAADFAAADAELGFNWIGLAQGQAFLKLGHHRDARRSLAPYLWNKAPLRWKAKALAWVLLSLVREVLHGSARRSEADGGAP
ncbi:MAG: hypothetical protein MO847_04455, partial [Candidatus Protistobacter heckmanni]|nr:hypothetical protein [Candidatus Protistobacter heckmanni]